MTSDKEVCCMIYSMEFRIAVANAYEECGSSIEVAQTFGCSASWVRRLMQRQRETGSLEPLPAQQPNTSKLLEQDLQQLRELIEKQPDLTLGELAAKLDNKVSVPTVWRATQKLELPLKKRLSTPASRTGQTSKKHAAGGLRNSPL